MAKRKGLLLDRGGLISSAVKSMRLYDWEFQVASSIDDIRKELERSEPLVGLVAFDMANPWPLREIEELVAGHDMEWIAILDGGLLRDRNVGPVILRSFHDFHTLPLDHQRLAVTLGHAYGKAAIIKTMSRPDSHDENGRYGMIGRSPRMLELYRQIDRIVTVDAPVLIGGESGTGKELVAGAIHRCSSRASHPFIAMNCGAIPSNLIQSELFGHERGAFTGAHQRKVGSIEAANGGVLFLDEIADLPLELQANLLRFLQEKTIVRVGSTERIRVDVRVIAATHVDLARAAQAGRFREDLFYRLNVLHLKVPPLRDRPGDVPLLADHVFQANQRQKSPQVRGFSSEALHAMREYAWPGNVRELINRVHSAMIMTDKKLIDAADLGIPVPEFERKYPRLEEARASVEKEIIVSNMHKYQNNVSEVARQLGISRVTLYRMMGRLKIAT